MTRDQHGGVPLRIDHATLGGPALAPMAARLARLGLEAEYGGAHDNGITHMSQVGFGDGSYLELIAPLAPGVRSPLWEPQISSDAGPAAWAVRGDDLRAERRRLEEAGIECAGPTPMARRRPDGAGLAWELLFPGQDPPGATLPFSIRDLTPRSHRVRPSPSAAAAGFTGLAGVVIAAHARGALVETFRRAYRWPAPVACTSGWLGADIEQFPGTPVALAEPSGGSGWLAERLARLGDSPCAFLLARESDSTAPPVPFVARENWLGEVVSWLDPGPLGGWRLGSVAGR
jgi:hypothetical protein